MSYIINQVESLYLSLCKWSDMQEMPSNLQIYSERKLMKWNFCCRWLEKPRWQLLNSFHCCHADVWNSCWKLDFLWDFKEKHCGSLTLLNSAGKPAAHHVILSSLAWLTKDTDLTEWDGVTEDDTSTSSMPPARCLSKYMVCETAWMRLRFHIIWLSLCWQKHGLVLSASSVLNPCIWTPRSCLLVVSARRKWRHRFQNRRNAKNKHLGDLECILCVLYTAK